MSATACRRRCRLGWAFTPRLWCSEDLVGLCAGGTKPGKTVFDGECYRMTDAQVAAWPAIEVVLGKDPESQATVTVAPQAYLREKTATAAALSRLSAPHSGCCCGPGQAKVGATTRRRTGSRSARTVWQTAQSSATL